MKFWALSYIVCGLYTGFFCTVCILYIDRKFYKFPFVLKEDFLIHIQLCQTCFWKLCLKNYFSLKVLQPNSLPFSAIIQMSSHTHLHHWTTVPDNTRQMSKRATPSQYIHKNWNTLGVTSFCDFYHMLAHLHTSALYQFCTGSYILIDWLVCRVNVYLDKLFIAKSEKFN